MKCRHCVFMGAVLLVLNGPVRANLLVNPSLELGTDPGSIGRRLGAGSAEISGWVVSRGEVDYTASYWQAADWLRTVDLNGGSGAAGGIQQTLATTPGQTYVVTFALAGNPDDRPSIKRMRVEAAGQSADYTFDTTDRSRESMGWVDRAWQFAANSTATTIEFYSLDGGTHGPALDDVCVEPLPSGAPVGTQRFRDTFDGSTLSSAWSASANGGSVTVSGGTVTLSSTGPTFPFVRNATPLIEAGNFRLTFRLKYNSVTSLGVGLWWSDAVPNNGDAAWCNTSIPSFTVYQDAGTPRPLFLAAFRGPCAPRSLDLSASQDLEWHDYEFRRIGPLLTLLRDGVVVWLREDPFGSSFPLNVWFGNPAVRTPAPWSSISIDEMAVYSLGGLSAGCSFANFSNTDGLILCGSTQAVDAKLRIVPALGGLMGGAFWALPLGAGGFTTDFRFRFGNLVGGGADGFTFCVRGPGSMIPGIGAGGGGLGFAGTGQSAAVEVDIFNNGGQDPNGNHIGIDVGPGIQTLVAAPNPLGGGVSLKDGNVYHLWVDYNGATMRVAIAPDGAPKPSPVLSQDLVLPFSVAMAGFTAATGGSAADHEILSWSFSSTCTELPSTISGSVTAHVLRRNQSTPLVQPLVGSRVLILRQGNQLEGGAALTQPPDGSFTISADLECRDRIASRLENDRLKVIDISTVYQGNCGTQIHPTYDMAIASDPVLIAWPVYGDGTSGDAANLFYLAEMVAREYWEGHGIATPLPLWIVKVQDVLDPSLGGAGTQRVSGGRACSSFEAGEVRADAVYHEFAHRMVIQVAGDLIQPPLQNLTGDYAFEAAGMDEGLADYFTAAFTGDSEIQGPGRDLDQPHPYQFNRCTGEYDSDRYYGARLFGGALWDLRGSLLLLGIPYLNGDVIDKWIYDAIGTLVQQYPNVADRKFLTYRDVLLATDIGRVHRDAIRNAFARHNISESPDLVCTERPTIQEVVRTVDHVGQHLEVTWTKARNAIYYRVYLRARSRAAGFALGTVIADSLIDSTYVYVDPDTTTRNAFVVTAIDSFEIESPASAESGSPVDVNDLDRLALKPSISAYPNPAVTGLVIEVQLPSKARARMGIYDVAGRRVRDLELHHAEERQRILWDGLDSHRRPVSSGVYFVCLTGERFQVVRRVVMVR